MNLYFILSCVFLILISFTVGESVLKTTKLNKTLCLIFLTSVIVFSFVPTISLLGVDVDFSILSLMFVIVVGFFYLKTRKGALKTSLISTVTIVTNLTYHAIFQNSYEFQFFQPYFVVAFVLGVVCYFVSKRTYVAVLGLSLGCLISSVLQVLLTNALNETFVFGTWAMDIFLIGLTAYVLTKHFSIVLKSLKRKKKNVLMQNQIK